MNRVSQEVSSWAVQRLGNRPFSDFINFMDSTLLRSVSDGVKDVTKAALQNLSNVS